MIVVNDIVREIVVYSIRPECLDDFRHLLLPEFREEVIRLTGCLAYETLSEVNDRRMFVDIVTWQSLADATKAVEVIQQLQQQSDKPWFNMFERSILFKHFKPVSDWCNFDEPLLKVG